MHLPIIFQDEHYVAINKPHNLLVHRSPIAADESIFALQLLRDQIKQWVVPCHRIDRKTAGVLLFALNQEASKAMNKQFEERSCHKKYIILVRGFVPESGTADRQLANENGVLKDAVTHYKCLEQIELEIPVSRYPTSRYSLVEVTPETGRMHQIRRHFAQMRHYLVGDKTYGECKQNKMFEQRFGLNTMLLHAQELGFVHPFTQENILIKAPLSDTFSRIIDEMGFDWKG